MKTIPLSSIIISPNRQRQEFDLAALNDLGESIKKFGLWHPVVLRKEMKTFAFEPGDGGLNETWQYILVSGERRIRAAKDIYDLGGNFTHGVDENDLPLPVPVGEIPYLDIGELDALAREEAELDENIKRANLTWLEQATATARLAALRTKQAAAAGLPPVPVAAIAEERRGSSAGYHQEITRREIIVAQHAADPEVRAAKSVDDAFKLLKRKEDTQRRVDLAAEVGRTYTSDVHTLLHEDSLGWMARAAEGQFDVICTDPIYGIGADEFGDGGGRAGPTGAHFYKDDYETWKEHVVVLARAGFRITKAQAHLYAFCDITRFEEFKAILSAAGWTCFRTPIIWNKPNGNRLPWVDSGPQRKYELILYAKKGGKQVTRIYPDLVTYTADENLGHQAQKPVQLIVDLLRRSVQAGDSVLDPFGGSCPILPAAQELRVKATAIEVDAAAYALGVGRMKKLKEQVEMELP